MTNLTKTVKRVTGAVSHEKSKTRQIVITVEPPATIGTRLQGTRDTYRLPVETIYQLAVQAHVDAIERRAKQIAKAEKVPMRQARTRARREMGEKLR